MLLVATLLSMGLGELTDGLVILAITTASVALGFVQERGAVHVIEDLLSSFQVHADILRSGVSEKVLLDEVVAGDVAVFNAGDVVPGDARLITSRALLVDESPLTGESLPVEKSAGVVPLQTSPSERSNMLWCGTHVVSGTGSAVIVATGADTDFGRIGSHLAGKHVPTAFEVGLREFGSMLLRAAGILVTTVFVINVVVDRSIIESLLFSLALAVGLTPQLLPAIVTVTLSRGARELSRKGVIVKRLDAIEDLGAIDVMCTDKTGTLTTGAVTLREAVDLSGEPNDRVGQLATLNAGFQQGFANPIDQAILAFQPTDIIERFRLVDELPYDFTRKLLSVLVTDGTSSVLITKGAARSVMSACSMDADDRKQADAQYERLSLMGYRVVGVASRTKPWLPDLKGGQLTSLDESGLHFEGFLCFDDQPKPDAAQALRALTSLGVATKMITGDNRIIARRVAESVGLSGAIIVLGEDITSADSATMSQLVEQAAVFAEIGPMQKERIIDSLRQNGHIVGYLGDGINDAPSLRMADVGISVDTATDIAKHTASIVLLEKDLQVLAAGIVSGRTVFANTIKYVQGTIAANFGNMISLAIAAIALPFLPLLPRQILLLNFLSDIPATTIATDRVDPETIAGPHTWDINRLRRFMVVFGLISSVFDLLTFAVLRYVFDASPALFRTGWFIESTATELAVLLVLRTWRRAWKSRPSQPLLWSSLAIAAISTALLFTRFAQTTLGMVRPTPAILGAVVMIVSGYVIASEIAKSFARPK